MESQVLQQDNLSLLRIRDDLLDLGSDAVWRKGNLLAEELLEFWDDWCQRVLLVALSVWTAKVGHQDDGLGAVVEGVLDGWDGAGDALGVGDVLGGIEWDVEVDLHGGVVLDGCLSMNGVASVAAHSSHEAHSPHVSAYKCTIEPFLYRGQKGCEAR